MVPAAHAQPVAFVAGARRPVALGMQLGDLGACDARRGESLCGGFLGDAGAWPARPQGQCSVPGDWTGVPASCEISSLSQFATSQQGIDKS